MIKVGIIGVGTIGSQLARTCLTEFKDDVRLVGVIDSNVQREKQMMKELGLKRHYDLTTLIKQSDLVIEAAGKASSYSIAKQALSMGKDVMIMSTGGIVLKEKEIYELASTHRCCIYMPSGAICGVDGIKSAGVGKIKSVSLTTRKNPNGFKNAPYLLKHKIDLNDIKEETLLFEGNAEKAIEGFPQNINVSATLSLAGIGPKKTKVKIYACPGLKHHIHEVSVEGEFGSLYTRTQNNPSKQNPKTSQLAFLSAIATLRRILHNVKIGT